MSVFEVDGVEELSTGTPLASLLSEPNLINDLIDELGDCLDSGDTLVTADATVVELLTHIQKSTSVYFKSMANDISAINVLNLDAKRKSDLTHKVKIDYYNQLRKANIGTQIGHKAKIIPLGKLIAKSISNSALNVVITDGGCEQLIGLSKSLNSILTRVTNFIEVVTEWNRILNRNCNNGYDGTLEIKEDLMSLISTLDKGTQWYGSDRTLTDSHRGLRLKALCLQLEDVSPNNSHSTQSKLDPWDMSEINMFESRYGANIVNWTHSLRRCASTALQVDTCKFKVDGVVMELLLDTCCLMSDRLYAMSLETKAFYLLAQQVADSIHIKYNLLNSEYKDLIVECEPSPTIQIGDTTC